MKADQVNNQRLMKVTTEKTNTKTGIGQKIKGSIIKISSKFRGIENIVQENISRFLKDVGDQYQIPSESIFIKIGLKDQHLLILIYGKSKLLKTATAYELIDFFIGLSTAKFLGIQDSIPSNVMKFLLDYAREHKIAVDELSMIIYSHESLAKVKSYQKDQFKEEIALSSLIEYFQQ